MPTPIPPVDPEDQQNQITQTIGASVDLQQISQNQNSTVATGVSADIAQSYYALNQQYDGVASNYIPSFAYTASGTVTETPCVVLVDATAGNIVLTIPSPSMAEGRTMTVQRLDATANTVTLTPAIGDVRITSTALSKLTVQYGVVDLTAVNNGTNVIWVGR